MSSGRRRHEHPATARPEATTGVPGVRDRDRPRHDRPGPRARWARGQLVELSARDLRYSADETAALVRQIADVELPPARLAALGRVSRIIWGSRSAVLRA